MMGKKSFHILFSLLFLLCKISSGQSYDALDFEENKGQWSGDFKYLSNLGDSKIFFQTNGFTVLKEHPDDYALLSKQMHDGASSQIKAPVKIVGGMENDHSNSQNGLINVRKHAYTVRFLGSSGMANYLPERPTGESSNYMLGDNPAKWKSGVKKFASLIGKELYSGIDIKYYGYGERLKYDLIVHPGADLSNVRIAYDGVDKISLKNGSLIIQTSVGETKEMPPYAYQIIGGLKKEVSCKYLLENTQVRFKIGEYDKTKTLYIDPIILISTYSGSRSNNYGFTAAPGPDGSLYAGGIVFGADYPIVPAVGAFQETFKSGGAVKVDIGLTRIINTTDSTYRIYSTYIGGSGDEFPSSIIVDPSGSALILGRTSSFNFPKTKSFGPGGGATDIFIIKLSPDGTTMIGGGIIGGTSDDGANKGPSLYTYDDIDLVYNYGDNTRSEVIIDSLGYVYIASSSSSTDFPVKNASQSNLAGQQDGVVLKLTPNLTDIVYSTYIGGSSDDAAFVLAHNPKDNSVYLSGVTKSVDLKGDKSGTIGQTLQGEVDGFVSQINSAGMIVKTTYLGTSSKDFIYGVQVDSNGFPYVMGITLGSWPVIKAKAFNEGSKQFISKLKPDLTDYVYSTVFGSSNARLPNISPVAFLVDRCENVYVSGWGGGCDHACQDQSRCSRFFSRTIGTRNMPLAGIQIQNYTDNRDFYFFVLERDAQKQLFGSYYGQFGGYIDHVDGGTSRFDRQGRIYMAICANCGGRNQCEIDPVTRKLLMDPRGVIRPGGDNNASLSSTRNPSATCNLFALRMDFELSNVSSGVSSSINGVARDKVGCVPLKVDFQDTIDMGVTYYWDFGDETTDKTTSPNNSHTFTKVGTYRVMLIAENPERCIPRDTSYVDIIVRSNKAELKAGYAKKGPCTSFTYTFDNLSLPAPGQTFASNAFEWDFGDKSQRKRAGLESVEHTFPAVGSYKVKLYLRDPSFCNENDYLEILVYVSQQLKASFTVDSIACFPDPVKFVNTSLGGSTFSWTFGDLATPKSITGADPGVVKFLGPGDYKVKLVVEDPNTCNKIDSSEKIVIVKAKPTSRFDFKPVQPNDNEPISFINQSSSDAIAFKWDFGDGTLSTARDTVHEYPKTDTYQVSLVAVNGFGCSDIYKQNVKAKIFPIADVPSAFTPNNDGVNDVLYVKAFGVSQMIFRIYNRWGQEVFVSASTGVGWDGKLKGELQPMDVYGYTLSILFTNGNTINRKGEITLIR